LAVAGGNDSSRYFASSGTFATVMMCPVDL
jgi:hypothetical protein